MTPVAMESITQIVRKVLHHDGLIVTCNTTLLMKCQQQYTAKARYHDVVNETYHLILSWKFPQTSPKKLGTMMLRMTHVM